MTPAQQGFCADNLLTCANRQSAGSAAQAARVRPPAARLRHCPFNWLGSRS
jgi:hypothetical protein